jgi:hypothetical protein
VISIPSNIALYRLGCLVKPMTLVFPCTSLGSNSGPTRKHVHARSATLNALLLYTALQCIHHTPPDINEQLKARLMVCG